MYCLCADNLGSSVPLSEGCDSLSCKVSVCFAALEASYCQDRSVLSTAVLADTWSSQCHVTFSEGV